jgi:hypothetical protein
MENKYSLNPRTNRGQAMAPIGFATMTERDAFHEAVNKLKSHAAVLHKLRHRPKPLPPGRRPVPPPKLKRAAIERLAARAEEVKAMVGAADFSFDAQGVLSLSLRDDYVLPAAPAKKSGARHGLEALLA